MAEHSGQYDAANTGKRSQNQLQMASKSPGSRHRHVQKNTKNQDSGEEVALVDSAENEQLRFPTTSKAVEGLLTFLILFLACLAAFSSRLFAVIRFESIIHEFDPW